MEIRMKGMTGSLHCSLRRDLEVKTTHRRPRVLLYVLLAVACVGLGSFTKTAPMKRFPFKGRVISIDQGSQSAVIDGDAIPGFMDAMAMTYKIKDSGALKKLSVGDQIAADVVVANEDYWLENVKVTGHTTPAADKPAAAMHVPAPREE